MISAVGILLLLACAAGVALSLQSIRYTFRRAPWTAAGWALTVGYFLAAAPKVWGAAAPFHLEYWCLGALTVAFVIAGVRDEPQAEPWFWPTRAGLTRAELRRKSP